MCTQGKFQCGQYVFFKKGGVEVDNLFVWLLLIKDARYTNLRKSMPNLAIYFKAAI